MSVCVTTHKNQGKLLNVNYNLREEKMSKITYSFEELIYEDICKLLYKLRRFYLKAKALYIV